MARKNYIFVPDLGTYEKQYDDKYLLKKWNISDKEWNYIDSRITKITNE